MTEHTPLPWRYVPSKSRHPFEKNWATIEPCVVFPAHYTRGSDGEEYAVVGVQIKPEDGEFVVRAVNSYDAMLAALEAAERFMTIPGSGYKSYLIDEIQTAIKKAKS